MITLLKPLASLLPAAVLIGAALAIPHYFGPFTSTQRVMIEMLPLLLYGTTLAVAARFNRSRIFFSLATLGLAWLILGWYLPGRSNFIAPPWREFLMLAVPVQLLTFSLIRERGLFTVWGISRFLVLLAPAALMAWIMTRTDGPEWLDFLHYAPPFRTDWTALTAPALFVYGFALLVTNGRLFQIASPQTAASLGSLVATAIAFALPGDPMRTALLFSACAIMFAVALLQESWAMAYIDELTSLPGRRALSEQLAKLSGRYTIAMLDVDHFKKFNDKHGHDAGDQVLRMVAARMQEVGGGGRAFRYGGEEFCVVFPGRDAEAAKDPLEELRKTIGETPFRLRSKERRRDGAEKKPRSRGKGTTTVTVSIGFAERNDKDPKPWAVLRAADKALYRAKRKGRNRVSS
ncbi:MAG: GGDEF domain-containing protein [Gammaproteobacteria bacterium]